MPSASVSNRVQVRNLSDENEYDLHSNGLVSKTHFHMKGFALGLVLKQRQKRTRKWPIRVCFGFALVRSLIGYKISRHFFNQSEVKPDQS